MTILRMRNIKRKWILVLAVTLDLVLLPIVYVFGDTVYRSFTIKIPVTSIGKEGDEVFSYRLKSDTKGSQTAKSEILRLKNGETGVFEIVFYDFGIYHYEISRFYNKKCQIPNNMTVYYVDIYVMEDLSGRLSGETVIYKKGYSEKEECCIFYNNEKESEQTEVFSTAEERAVHVNDTSMSSGARTVDETINIQQYVWVMELAVGLIVLVFRIKRKKGHKMRIRKQRRWERFFVIFLVVLWEACNLQTILAFETGNKNVCNILGETMNEVADDVSNDTLLKNEIFSDNTLTDDMSKEKIPLDEVAINDLPEEMSSEEILIDEILEDEIKTIDTFADGKIQNTENENKRDTVFEDGVGSSEEILITEIKTLVLYEDAYAILYENGDMVFQRGDTPDSDKGTVIGIYAGFEDTYNKIHYQVPWKSVCSFIKTVTFKDEICPTSMTSWFNDCTNLVTFDSTNLNMSELKEMDSLFWGCSSLTSLDASGWNLGSVTNMNNLFYGCDNLKKLILGRNFRFVGDNMKLSGECWVRTSTGETYSPKILYSVYDGNIMADTYCRTITITFHGNGGTSVPKTMAGYLDMIPDELPTASKKGAYFAGWYTQMQGGEVLREGDPVTQDIYYAQWDDYVYTLILKAMNESKDEVVVDLSYNTCYALSENLFTYDGMKLTGWNTRRDGSGAMYKPGEEVMRLSETDQDTVILYAQWEKSSNLITVSFDSCGGAEVPPVIIERGTGINNLIKPKKEGYTFLDWHIFSADGEKVTDTMVFTEDVVLYAEWKKNPVVTFDSNGGGSQNIQRMLSYGSTVGDLPVYQPNSNRYMSLIGWFTDSAQGERIDENWIITEDVVFYAHWGWKPIFNANGGFITEDQDFPIQESSQYVIDRLPKVKRDEYVFEGWYLTDGITKVLEGDCVDLTAGIEIVAHWIIVDTMLLSLNIDVESAAPYILSETTYHTSGLQAYDLTVQHNVLGNMGDRAKDFHFKLKLSEDTSDKEPGSICYEKDNISGSIQLDENGMYNFTLRHGQSISFKEITSGTAYELIETDGELQGYKVESENSVGIIEDTNVTSVFTNTKNVSIPTGIDIHSGMSVLLVLLSGIFFAVFIFVRRKT